MNLVFLDRQCLSFNCILSMLNINNLIKIMKKFMKVAFVAIFAVTAGYGVYSSQKLMLCLN